MSKNCTLGLSLFSKTINATDWLVDLLSEAADRVVKGVDLGCRPSFISSSLHKQLSCLA